MSHFCNCSYLPSLFSANSKCKFLADLQLHLIWFYFSSVGVGAMVDNQTHPQSTHLLCPVQLSAVSKRTTIFEHQNLRTLSTWKIALILLKWQWNFADWKLHGTWIIYSVPEAILSSCGFVVSSLPHPLCKWNPWNSELSLFWCCLGSSGSWLWSCA